MNMSVDICKNFSPAGIPKTSELTEEVYASVVRAGTSNPRDNIAETSPPQDHMCLPQDLLHYVSWLQA